MAHARKREGSVHLSVHPSTEEVLPRDGPRLATSWITANFVIESKMSAGPRRIFPRYFVGGSGFLSGSLVELMSSPDRRPDPLFTSGTTRHENGCGRRRAYVARNFLPQIPIAQLDVCQLTFPLSSNLS